MKYLKMDQILKKFKMNLLISISLLKEETQCQWEILRTGLNFKNKNGGTLLKCPLKGNLALQAREKRKSRN